MGKVFCINYFFTWDVDDDTLHDLFQKTFNKEERPILVQEDTVEKILQTEAILLPETVKTYFKTIHPQLQQREPISNIVTH